MPFAQTQLDEIANLTRNLEEDYERTISNPPQILTDFRNALGVDNLVPVVEDGQEDTVLTERHVALLRSLCQYPQPDIEQFVAQRAVGYEIEKQLCDEFIKAWLDAGGPINFEFIDGYSPLHLAILNGADLTASELIDAGADVDMGFMNHDFSYITPLYTALCNGYSHLAEILIFNMANLTDDIKSLVLGGRTREILDTAIYCYELTDRLIQSKIQYRNMQRDNEVIDIIPAALQNEENLETERSEHFQLLYTAKRDLIAYRRLVNLDEFEFLFNRLVFCTKGNISYYITSYLTEEVARRAAAAAGGEDISRSPAPREPMRFASRVPDDIASAAGAAAPGGAYDPSVEPVAPSLERPGR